MGYDAANGTGKAPPVRGGIIVAMPLMWAAKCKKCGKLSAVRPSKSAGRELELRNPSEKFEKLACPHCSAVNDFLGSDLEEVLAYIDPAQPKS